MIVAAALQIEGMTISMPKPARHGDIIARFGADGDQGFLTSAGTFAHRRLAHRIAFKAGQVATMDGELFSEDLW